jgi:hypothetical protein
MRGRAGFFDVDERLKQLSAKSDSLEQLNAVVDFELFRADLERAVPRSEHSKRRRSRIAGACLMLCLFAPLPLLAQSPARDRTWFATVYAGQWFSESAPDPGQTLGTQDAGFQDSYFVSALLSRVLVRELKTELPLIGPLIDDSSIELEGQIGHHFGLQDHAEVTLALQWRSRDFVMPLTNGRLNLAVGEGLSYAFAPGLRGRLAWPRAPKIPQLPHPRSRVLPPIPARCLRGAESASSVGDLWCHRATRQRIQLHRDRAADEVAVVTTRQQP